MKARCTASRIIPTPGFFAYKIALGVLTLAVYALCSPLASAENIIRAKASIQPAASTPGVWRAIEDRVGEWITVNPPGCSSWIPQPSDQPVGVAFQQSRFCYPNKYRLVQAQEQNSKTGEIRAVGDEEEESAPRYSEWRMAYGTKEPKTCRYDPDNYYMRWISTTDPQTFKVTYSTQIAWGELRYTANGWLTLYRPVINGAAYTTGDTINNRSEYQVCRE